MNRHPFISLFLSSGKILMGYKDRLIANTGNIAQNICLLFFSVVKIFEL
jgi:hypothetical protein